MIVSVPRGTTVKLHFGAAFCRVATLHAIEMGLLTKSGWYRELTSSLQGWGHFCLEGGNFYGDYQ